MLPKTSLPRPSAEGLGTLVDYPEGLRRYEGYLVFQLERLLRE